MPAGRPTDYKPEYCEQVEKLCKLGATDEEMAEFFNVCEATINNWKNEHPEFLDSIKNGREIADAEVSEKLYQRACGYSHDAEEIKVVSCGANMGSSIERVNVVKHYPPDPTAAIFWLKNRQPKKWRDKHEIEHSGSIDFASELATARARKNSE